jgi:hypothetical protein
MLGSPLLIRRTLAEEAQLMTMPAAQASLPPSGQSLSWSQVWLYALTRPSEANFQILLNDPQARPGRGLIWVGITSLIASLIAVVFQILFRPNIEEMTRFLQRDPGAGAQAGTIVLALLCGIPAGAIFAVLGTVIYTALVNFTAGALGGKGNFNQLVYLFSAITAPLSLLGVILGLVPIVNCLTFPLAVYSIYLDTVAVKTVHQLDWLRAAASVLILLILVILIVAVCGVALLLPIIREATRTTF